MPPGVLPARCHNRGNAPRSHTLDHPDTRSRSNEGDCHFRCIGAMGNELEIASRTLRSILNSCEPNVLTAHEGCFTDASGWSVLLQSGKSCNDKNPRQIFPWQNSAAGPVDAGVFRSKLRNAPDTWYRPIALHFISGTGIATSEPTRSERCSYWFSLRACSLARYLFPQKARNR